MNKGWGAFLISGICLVVSACGGNEDSKPANAQNPANEVSILTSNDLRGLWVTDCVVETGGSKPVSTSTWVRFGRETFTSWARVNFGNTQCSGSDTLTHESMVRFEMGGALESLEGGRQLKLTPVARFLTATGAQVGVLNGNKYCGLSDWKDGERRDLTRAHCPELGDDDQKIYTAVQVKQGRLTIEVATQEAGGVVKNRTLLKRNE